MEHNKVFFAWLRWENGADCQMHHMPFCRVQLRQMNHQFASWADGARCILDFKTFLPCPGNFGSIGRLRGMIDLLMMFLAHGSAGVIFLCQSCD